MTDRTGKELQVGQSVDILLNGIFTGVIVNIRQAPLAVSKNQVQPPQLVIQLMVSHVPHDGRSCAVYVVAEAQPEGKGLIQ